MEAMYLLFNLNKQHP